MQQNRWREAISLGTFWGMSYSIAPDRPELDPILRGGGECGALMQAMDWTSHPLGTPQTWVPELRTIVAIALASTQPMLIVWGAEQITFYNDGYAAMCGSRHPTALGRPFGDLWFDIWDRVDPILRAAYAGVSTSMDDIEFVMLRNGYPEEAHFAFSYSPVRDGSGEVLGMFCACVETTEQVMAQRRLAADRAQMRQIFERALGAVAILSGPDHVFAFANEEYQTLVGHRGIVGKSVAEALPEVAEQGFVKLLDAVLETGEAHVGRGVEIDLRRTPGEVGERLVLDFAYHPVGDSDGRPEGIFVQVIDVTARADAERQQRLLNAELAHRMKNQLALVQAIANLTLRTAVDLTGARTSLNQRIAVLARAQDMVLAGTTEATMVVDIVEEVTLLHDDLVGSRFQDRRSAPLGRTPSGVVALAHAARAGNERGEVRRIVERTRHRLHLLAHRQDVGRGPLRSRLGRSWRTDDLGAHPCRIGHAASEGGRGGSAVHRGRTDLPSVGSALRDMRGSGGSAVLKPR